MVEELRKQKEAEMHREKMLEDMKIMTVKARREAERQTLEQQAYKMHCEEQQNFNVNLKEVDRSERGCVIVLLLTLAVFEIESVKISLLAEFKA